MSDPLGFTKGSIGQESYGKEDGKASSGGIILPTDVKIQVGDDDGEEPSEEDGEYQSKMQLRNE